MVFIPPLSESGFFSSMRSFLSRRQLGLAELFSALDSDLDGALSGAEVRALVAHVVPGAAASDVLYLMVRAKDRGGWCSGCGVGYSWARELDLISGRG